MAEDGVFPRSDVISYTTAGKEWINHEWLSQIMIYSVFKFSGFAGVGLIVALSGAVIYFLLFRRKNILMPDILVLAATAYALKPFFVPRPQIFAYIAFLSFILAIDWFYRTNSKRILYILPGILFVWANIHASVILALPVIFAYLIFEFGPLAKFNKKRLAEEARKNLLRATLLGLGLTLANPFFYKIYWQALQPLRFSGTFNALIETQSILKISQSRLLLPVHLGLIFILAWRLFRKKFTPRYYEAVTLPLFLFMPFMAIKYLPFSWMAVLPVIVRIMPKYKNWVLEWLAIAAFLIYSAAQLFNGGTIFKNAHEEWPKELAGFMAKNQITANIYNPYSWGGYISWEDRIPVFINVALDNMGGEVFRDAIDFDKGERTDDIIKKYNLKVVVAQPWTVSPYILSLKDGWALVYWDNYGVIFVKEDAGYNDVINKNRLDIKYFNDSVESVLRKYKTAELPTLVRNYQEAIKRHPDLLLARFRLGLIYQYLDQCPKAIEQYNALADINYKLGSVHFRLAECYKKLGDLRSAGKEKDLADKFRGKETWWKSRR